MKRSFLRRAGTVIAVGLLCVWNGPGNTAELPSLPVIGEAIAHDRPGLQATRDRLSEQRAALFRQVDTHNKACRTVDEGSEADRRCTQQLDVLTALVERHRAESAQLIKDVAAASERQRIIDAINRLAENLRWPQAKRDRLGLALRALDDDGDPDANGHDVQLAWRAILARGQSAEMAALAATGQGPSLIAAGTQSFEDCAVFALANAANLPYGVVAARATKLIGEGDWRNARDRADPQKAIEAAGLIGGEVAMLAEAFGQVEIVNSKAFAKTLKAGRAIMINVVPESGEIDRGHQVVLSRVFRNGSETWYQMIDSNQGPLRRLYLSDGELRTILKENGVGFRPEDKATVPLLR